MSTYEALNFIEEIIEEDIKSGKHNGTIHTRFPPEPNGYLHIGHAKAICINFEMAKKYGGQCNLRFDDTNPVNEDTEYVEAIKRDINWLGYEWHDQAYYASDYFGQLYDFAVKLIEKGLAYIDDSTAEEIAEMKGTPTEPGTNSPFRERPIAENLEIFADMKAGKYPDGAKVLRAKIDMSSPNMHMRDPVIYRIKHAHHHRTGDDWCIYPMYDFAHGQSDSIENITHSLCSLEFRHHRPLYDWLIEKLEIFPSRQIEFARMNVEYMITSKRRLRKLVEGGYVSGWDDPRMSTLSALRRKGYPPAAIRTFCDKVGVAKRENLIEINLLEACVREELNKVADRVMVVTDPVKLVITNYPEGQTEELTAINNPEDENSKSRILPFSKELYIERDDFMEDAPKKYFRLSPGRNVRLKFAYIVNCERAEYDADGNLETVYASYYPNSKSGSDESGIKAKGTLHWVDATQAKDCEVRVYDRLYTDPTPTKDPEVDFLEYYNEDSLQVIKGAKMEPALAAAKPGARFQFMRKGYYVVDTDSTEDEKIFNLTVSLKDGYKKKK